MFPLSVSESACLSFSNAIERMVLVRAVCAVYEGAAVAVPEPASAAQLCVAAVLADPRRRFTQLRGREGMQRSFASVYGGCAVLFLGSTFRGVVKAVYDASFRLQQQNAHDQRDSRRRWRACTLHRRKR